MPKRSIPMLTAIFLMLTFSSCTCIYFNTFYNIRKSFGAAEKSRKEAGRDKAGGGEVKQYNDAIAKASRVLERHPTSSYVDDALYIIGTSYYYLGEYSKATRKFKELFANYPQSEYVPRSRLLMAKAKLKLNEEAEAVVIFEEIFQKEKNKEMKAEAARSLGEYYFENRDYEKSNTYFMALVDSLGNQNERLNALIYVADGYFDMFSLQSAIDDYNTALKQDPDTLQYYHIMFRLAECDIYLSRITEGIEKLSELADNEVYYDSLAPIRLKMAEGYEWEGDFNSAIDTYERIITENPRRDPAAIAYYRLGLIYQYDYENLSKARAYYQKSREERSNSPVAEDATRRASKLALLEQYTQSGQVNPEADSTQEIDLQRLDELSQNEFLLAELFYFDLEKPDSAINTYKVLLDRYPTSRYAPRALMSMAHIYQDEFNDTTGADSLLRLVLKRYPHYDEAEDVINMLGLAGTVADTGYAAIPFAKAENFLSEFQELDSSMYYIQQRVDSMFAADSSAALDTLPADTTHPPDSLAVEDIYLQSNGGIASDSARVADSLRQADSLRAADSLQAAEQERIGDSARVADSIQVADSLRAMQLARLADSLRELRAQAAASPPKDTINGPDSLLPSDTMSLAEMVARAHEGADTMTAADSTQAVVDTSGMAPSPPIEVGQIVGPPRPDQMLNSGPMNPLDSLRRLHAQATQGTSGQPAGQMAGAGQEVPPPEPPQMGPPVPSLDLEWGRAGQPGSQQRAGALPTPSDIRSRASVGAASVGGEGQISGPSADTGASDTTVVPQKSFTEYWDEAMAEAKDRYNARQLGLLDSARYYYRLIIDSFPYSRYSVQSRYVLLWSYDHYLDPGDSSLEILYNNFVDSFPQSEYAQAIADEYGIRSAAMIPTRKNQNQQQKKTEPEVDSTALAQADSTGQEGQAADTISSTVSKFITRDGKQLEPANKYFLQEDVPFEYPLEALQWTIEEKLYFQIRIDFSGKVVDLQLMNPTQSEELNDRATETVKNTRFDNGRIPAELYDSWFYYTYEVHPPQQLRQ